MPGLRFLLVATALWSLFGLLAGIQVWISMLSHGHHVPWLLLYHQLVWLAWLLPTLLVRALAQRWPVVAARPAALAVHVLACLLISALHAVYEIGLMRWMQPYDRMTATLSELPFGEIAASRLLLGAILYCLVLGGVTALDYTQRFNERALRAAQLERALADIRLHALQRQLQPHFVFNTLNAIAALVRTRQHDQATGMIAGLADLLRYSLDHEDRQTVPLGEEVAVLQRYLAIEATRFADRLHVRIAVPESLQRASVPLLILQPLAENAVRHGIARLAAGGEIAIDARRVGERLLIRLRNDGALLPAAADGIGLRNTRERLAALYGGAARFTLTAAAGGVLAELDLPWAEIA
jgi:two-component system, LytTR family, sensor kinase